MYNLEFYLFEFGIFFSPLWNEQNLYKNYILPISWGMFQDNVPTWFDLAVFESNPFFKKFIFLYVSGFYWFL